MREGGRSRGSDVIINPVNFYVHFKMADIHRDRLLTTKLGRGIQVYFGEIRFAFADSNVFSRLRFRSSV